MGACLFCNIVARKTPAELIFEDEDVLAFRDIRPVAPVHALVIPKKHVDGVHAAAPIEPGLLGRVVVAAREVAEKLGLGTSGYRLVINEGTDAGQSVFHLHCHVLGGRPMSWPPG
jgi:histidine triad (HIT) family protein